MDKNWRNDPRFFSFEERLKHTIFPPKLYLRNLVYRRLRRGEQELHLLKSLVKPGSIAIDIGANKGLYSFLLSRIADTVKAFEPNPKMYSLLSRAVPDNVETFEVALSNESGEGELMIPIHRNGRYSNQGGTLQALKKFDGKTIAKWPIWRERLDKYGFEGISFIKIDVEGFELEVLDGAKTTIAREKPNLLIEIDPNQNGISLKEALKYIQELGYKTFVADGAGMVPLSSFRDTLDSNSNYIFLPNLTS